MAGGNSMEKGESHSPWNIPMEEKFKEVEL